MKESTTVQDGENDALAFIQKDRLELIVDFTEAVALVKMAQAMLNDPEDRLSMRDMWEEKAQKVWDKFYGRVLNEHRSVGTETRHKDWIGD